MEQWNIAGLHVATRVSVLSLLLALPLAGAAQINGVGDTEQAAPPASAPVAAGSLGPDILKSIRAATFEVVLRKPDNESPAIQYDKPLPLDLLPFSVRNDKYESIGTAFAIAPGRFVTAAHVTNVASGSLWGAPALRDAQGKVYPIDRVLRFSLDEDFIVFTAAGAPQVAPLPTSTSYQFDTPVYAVGNALGQGIVARDGTLTSETPEDQDGRWKWLRFSAAASPGNSGGPLLDAQGRVIGLISRKSANENLNFALPIALVLNAPENKATMDVRYTVSLPFLAPHKSVKLQAGIDLPQSFAEFDRRFIAVTNQHTEAAQRQLLQDYAAEVFPRGKSSLLLADQPLGAHPAFITEQADGTWDVQRKNAGISTALGTDGYVWATGEAGGPLFHIHYPADLDAARARGDSKLLAEQILKGITFNRTVGSENVRLVSLGNAAGKPEEFRDAEGRLWQQWRYPMLYADSTLLVMTTPVPDGYVGFARSSGQGSLERVAAELKLMTDFLQVSYAGTLPQWRSFLAASALRPESFGKWKAALDPAGEISLELPRLSVKVNKEVLNLTDQSTLSVYPGTLLEGEHGAWDVLAVRFTLDPRGASLVAVRRARPAGDAGETALRRWNNMTQQSGQFAGNPMRDPQAFWASKVAGAGGTPFADAKFLYDVTYTTPTIRVQGEVPRATPHLLEMVTVREK